LKRRASQRPLTKGINALARVADRTSTRGAARGGSFVLSERPEALASDEVLIAVADATSVALKLVKVPARRGAAVRGPTAQLENVARRIAEIDLVATEIARAAGRAMPAPSLTEQEEHLLRDADLDPRPLGANETPMLYRATAEYATLVNDSYTVGQAADLLDVNTSRIRQRLLGEPRTLYGIKFGKGWRIPRFQFQGRRLVPGIETVLRHMPANLHPVAVHRWFTSPNPDLTSAGQTRMSPLDWLRVGNPPGVVADLATDL
jgi:hypothetical protein